MIALISDTHENEAATKKAVELIKERKPEFTIHLGDIISPPMLDLFKGLKMKILLGNNDGEVGGLKKKCREHGFEEPYAELTFEHAGRRFFCYHGTDQRIVDNNIYYGGFDYVLCGHTHVRRDERRGKTRIINPGALFRAKEYSIAFLDIESDKLESVTIEKGE